MKENENNSVFHTFVFSV